MASIPGLITALGRHDGEIYGSYRRICENQGMVPIDAKCVYGVGSTVVKRVLRTADLLNNTSLDILHGAVCGTVGLFRQFIRITDSPVAHALRGIANATDEPTVLSIPSMAYQYGHTRVPYCITYNPQRTATTTATASQLWESQREPPVAEAPIMPPVLEIPAHGLRDLISDASNSRFVADSPESAGDPTQIAWDDLMDDGQSSEEGAITPAPTESPSFTAFHAEIAREKTTPSPKRRSSPSGDESPDGNNNNKRKKKKKRSLVPSFFDTECEKSSDDNLPSASSGEETAADRAMIDDGPIVETVPQRRRDAFSDSD